MPYSKYTHDIFVSYRHLDNQRLQGEESGWVSRLHHDLAARVAQWLGSDIEIWRDKRLQGNEDFSATILQAVADVAAFVAIVTPGYEESDWCRQELDAFIAVAETKGGINLGTKSRLFKILKTPVSLQKQPRALRSFLGYEFFNDEKEFDFLPDPKLAKQLYRAKLDDLAKEIHLLLKELTNESTTRSGHAGSQNKKAVYLAWTTSDLQDCRDKIRRELLDRDYLVLPDRDPPLNGASLADAVRRWLEQCCLSIHPLGGKFGMIPEGDTRSLPWLQHDLAAERYKQTGLCRILWMPKDIQGLEENQKDFLNRIEREIGGLNNGFQLLKISVEELKTIVVQQLNTEVQVPSPAKTTVKSNQIQIYFVCERGDRNVAEPLVRFLRQTGYLVDMPDFSGDRADHQATLRECDSVLIYHGTASEAWLREKIRDCRKAFGWGREKPFLANGIYLGPESSQAKSEFETNEYLVCRSPDSVSAQALEPYITALSHAFETHQ